MRICRQYGRVPPAARGAAVALGNFDGVHLGHRGVIGRAANYFYLPRFSMNEKYGDLRRFRLAINALPLPVSDVTPSDPMITAVNPMITID